MIQTRLSMTDINPYLGFISVRVSVDRPNIGQESIDECNHWEGADFPRAVTLDCVDSMQGRYVSVRRMGGYHLYRLFLCEIAVWGNQAHEGERG